MIALAGASSGASAKQGRSRGSSRTAHPSQPPRVEIIWEVSGAGSLLSSVLGSRFLLPVLSFQLLDAGCDRGPSEEIVSRSVDVVASAWLSVVLEDGSWDIAAIVVDVIETDPDNA